MKIFNYIIILLPLFSFSQVTGISEETKRDIVTTLLDYPIVIQENNILKEKIKELELIIDFKNKQLDNKDKIIDNYKLEVKNLESQISILENETIKKKSGLFLYAQTNLNGFTNYGAGIDYQFKNTLIIGANTMYYSMYKEANINVKLGFKLL